MWQMTDVLIKGMVLWQSAQRRFIVEEMGKWMFAKSIRNELDAVMRDR